MIVPISTSNSNPAVARFTGNAFSLGHGLYRHSKGGFTIKAAGIRIALRHDHWTGRRMKWEGPKGCLQERTSKMLTAPDRLDPRLP